MALLSDEDSPVTKELKKQGIDKEKVLSSLSQIRGSYRIADENPEEKFNALQKQDISTLVTIGHFYFGLTIEKAGVDKAIICVKMTF